MPFEQKYTPETRDASLARVLERREVEPGNRSIIRETAEQFEVGEQSLRGWIRSHEKANAPAAAPEAADQETAPIAAAPSTPADPAPAPRRGPGRPPASASASPAASAAAEAVAAPRAVDARVAELEAEVAKLRRDRESLKAALAVLLDD